LPQDISSPRELVESIKARRGGILLNLDRVLLYNENLAKGWNSFFGSLRSGLSLDAKTREMVIIYVGIINRAEYEVYQHTPDYLKAGGKL
jgi:alkylhydroperoxidase/carboxymuconolactone decarboxylase family protein YurZ